MRDTAIGKRWICSDLERSTHGCGPWRGQVLSHRMWCGCFFPSWVISYANEWEDHSIIGEPTVDCLGTACLWVCHLACRLKIMVYLNLTCHFGPIWFESVYVMPLGYVILSKVVPCPFPSVSCSFPEPFHNVAFTVFSRDNQKIADPWEGNTV